MSDTGAIQKKRRNCVFSDCFTRMCVVTRLINIVAHNNAGTASRFHSTFAAFRTLIVKIMQHPTKPMTPVRITPQALKNAAHRNHFSSGSSLLILCRRSCPGPYTCSNTHLALCWFSHHTHLKLLRKPSHPLLPTFLLPILQPVFGISLP